MSWEKEVQEIHRRRVAARAQGGEEGVSRQHNYGKLTVRERIDAIADPGSFREHGQLAGAAYLDEEGELESFTPANYVVGLGKIEGRSVAIGGEDFTLKGGSPSASGLRKSVYAEHLAVDYKVPLVRFLEGGGGSVNTGGDDPRKPKTVGSPVYDPHRFRIIADAMGVVPVVSAALGPVAGFPAGRLVASHYTVMTRELAQVMVAGPAVVERALGLSLSKEELGGADVHARSGLVDHVADTEEQAFTRMRQFLGYLPTNVWEHAERRNCDDPVDRMEEKLLSIVPRNRRHAFKVETVVKAVVDKGSFFPLAEGYGKGLLIGLARINGQSVGITANDCRFNAGAMTMEAAQKMRRIVELCDTFHLPLVNFIDEPGFMIGPDAEANGTIRYGMAAVAAASQAATPWASVQIHKNFGVASAAHYGPDTFRLNWPSAQSGPLPIEGGVAVAFRRQIAAAENPEAMRAELEDKLASQRKPYPKAESFAVHDLIDPRETRPVLCDWVDWIQPKLKALHGPTKFAIRP